MEDDAIFQNAVLHTLDPALFPPDWDVVFLDAYLRHKPPHGHVTGNVYSMDSYRGGTAGYLISKRGAGKLLRITSLPVCHPIDLLMMRYEYHRTEGVTPWVELELSPCSDFRAALWNLRRYDVIVSSRFHAIVAANVMNIPHVAVGFGSYYQAKMAVAVRRGSPGCFLVESPDVSPVDIARQITGGVVSHRHLKCVDAALP